MIADIVADKWDERVDVITRGLLGWTKADDGKVSVNDLHATILHLLGMDHEKLTYR